MVRNESGSAILGERIDRRLHLICTNCDETLNFLGADLRPLPVERGDAQAFQVRDGRGNSTIHIFRCIRCGAKTGEPTDPTWAAETFASTKLFSDPSPNGQINMRVLVTPVTFLGYTNLSDDEKHVLFNTLVLCAKKLVAVWQHKARYAQMEDQLVAKALSEAVIGDRNHYREHAQDLFIEFDEFLVQLKSSLDYLVKIPVPIVGARRWTLRTFGEKGEKVIVALKKNMPAAKRKVARGIAAFVVERHQPWLTDVITARDRLNHMIGEPVAFEEFMVYPGIASGSSVIQVHRPRWSPQQTVREMMDAVWENHIRLFEDFIMTFLYLRFRQEFALFHGVVDPGASTSPWRVTSNEETERVVSQPGWRAVRFDD